MYIMTLLSLCKMPKRELYGFTEEMYCFDSIKNKHKNLYPYYIHLCFTSTDDIEQIKNEIEDIINNDCLDYIVSYRRDTHIDFDVKVGVHENELFTVIKKFNNIASKPCNKNYRIKIINDRLDIDF